MIDPAMDCIEIRSMLLVQLWLLVEARADLVAIQVELT